MNKKRVLSLFSGCGGMDLGLEGDFRVKAGCINSDIHSDWIINSEKDNVLLKKTIFQTVFANDILPSAKAAWVPYFSKRTGSKNVFHSDSIVDLVKSAEIGDFSFPSNIDLITGGFPCQDFSVAGRRLGFNSHKNHLGDAKGDIKLPTNENRGNLYIWMREVIKIVRPKMFIAENVKGLISLGNAKKIIENDFKSIGDNGYYVLPAQVLHAGEFGVPQSRERIFFIGLNKEFLNNDIRKLLSKNFPPELNPYPPKTHFLKPSAKSLFGDFDNKEQSVRLSPFVKSIEVLHDLNEPMDETEDLSHMSYSKARFYGKMQGNTEINLNGLAPTIRAEHHGNIEFRRLNSEHGGKYLDELNKGKPERRLTVRECARIQTFPDDMTFVRKGKRKDPYNLSASGAYRVIGNAVPPLLAYNFAKRLEAIWSELFI